MKTVEIRMIKITLFGAVCFLIKRRNIWYVKSTQKVIPPKDEANRFLRQVL